MKAIFSLSLVLLNIGITSVLLTTPFWVAKSRLKYRHNVNKAFAVKGNENLYELLTKHSPFLEILNIGQTEGLSGLWSGCKTSIILSSCNSILQSTIYEILNVKLRKHSVTCNECYKKKLSVKIGTILSLLLISRCSTAAVTYPLFLVQSKQRVSNNICLNKQFIVSLITF